jgi:hypothetical protein
MADVGPTNRIRVEIAALMKLKDELAQQVRDEGVGNPQYEEVRRLFTEYDRCEKELIRMKRVLKKYAMRGRDAGALQLTGTVQRCLQPAAGARSA